MAVTHCATISISEVRNTCLPWGWVLKTLLLSWQLNLHTKRGGELKECRVGDPPCTKKIKKIMHFFIKVTEVICDLLVMNCQTY